MGLFGSRAFGSMPRVFFTVLPVKPRGTRPLVADGARGEEKKDGGPHGAIWRRNLLACSPSASTRKAAARGMIPGHGAGKLGAETGGGRGPSTRWTMGTRTRRPPRNGKNRRGGHWGQNGLRGPGNLLGACFGCHAIGPSPTAGGTWAGGPPGSSSKLLQRWAPRRGNWAGPGRPRGGSPRFARHQPHGGWPGRFADGVGGTTGPLTKPKRLPGNDPEDGGGAPRPKGRTPSTHT